METKELEKESLTMIEAQKRTIYKVLHLCQRPERPERPVSGDGAQPMEEFPALSGDSNLTTWGYRIAMNICIMFLRRSNPRLQTVPMTANVASKAADAPEVFWAKQKNRNKE